jgi:hypothetical protein
MWLLARVEVRRCEAEEFLLSSPEEPNKPNMDRRRLLSDLLEPGRGVGAAEETAGVGAGAVGLECVIRRPKSLSLPNLPLRECLLDLLSEETEGVVECC